MNFYSELSPVGQSPAQVYDWNSRNSVLEAVASFAPEAPGLSIGDIANRKEKISLGAGGYFGGSITRHLSDYPVCVSGVGGGSWVKTQLSVSNRAVRISNVGFDMSESGRAAILANAGSTVVLSNCVFKGRKQSLENIIKMENTAKVSITSCVFYSGQSSARIVSGGFVLGDLVIATSFRDFGAAWASGPFVGIGNIS